MILSVDPLVTGAIVTISYILSNFTPTDPIRFATLYDDGIAGKVPFLDLWLFKFWLIYSFKILTVQAQYYSEDPPITQANVSHGFRRINPGPLWCGWWLIAFFKNFKLWEYTTLPNGMSILRNQETGRLLSLNISDILDSFWNVHLYTGDLSKVPGNLNTTEGCCYE